MSADNIDRIAKAAEALRKSSGELWYAWEALRDFHPLDNARCAIADTILDLDQSARALEKYLRDTTAPAPGQEGGE